MRQLLICIGLFFLSALATAQQPPFKVGVVLSGGGAKAFAHVGVLKALDELNIPIDYITGTSSGAFIGALYAIGYSPDEIQQMFRQPEFLKLIQGEVDQEISYWFKQGAPSAEIASLKFELGDPWESTLPTHLISPVPLDYELFRMFTPATAVSKGRFDSLMVQFRCVASDIQSKSLVTFKNGNLASAIRASMAYPFYLKPVVLNDTLYFDGGLYNNFPADIMHTEFAPDYIIGSNVSENYETPDPDNVISQIKTLMVANTNYNIEGPGVLIEPQLEGVKTFDFEEIEAAFKSGYDAAMALKSQLRNDIPVYSDSLNLADKRRAFRASMPPIEVGEVSIVGDWTKWQRKYLMKNFSSKRILTESKFKDRLYRMYSDDKIRSVYPVAFFNDSTCTFSAEVQAQKEKDFHLEFGGNFSSRPINMGYIGARYNHLGRASWTFSANSYFGKLYGSGQVGMRIDFPTRPQLFGEAYFRLNRWDYFKSAATFFEDVKPSFIVQNEAVAVTSIGLPITLKSLFRTEFSVAELEDSYYQNKAFASTDTADISKHSLRSVMGEYEYNSLNRKQYATEGSYVRMAARYVESFEASHPGSTAIDRTASFSNHNWYTLKLNVEHYYAHLSDFHLGVTFEGVHSTMDEFNNFTASVLRAPAFNPTPESRTLFLESFRAYTYAALGKQVIYSITEDLDVRLEGHIFQPLQKILRSEDQTVTYGDPFEKRYIIGHTALVYHSPFGPFSVQVNYYQNVPEITTEDRTPITFLFHYGYIIYNRKALR